MTEKEELINKVLPSTDLWDIILKCGIYDGLYQCVEKNKITDKNLYTSEYIKDLMTEHGITNKTLVNELMNINEPNANFSYVSKICGAKPSRNVTPDIMLALLNNIEYPQVGLREVSKWLKFITIIKFLDNTDSSNVITYSIKYGKEILSRNSIDKIKEAINYFDNYSDEDEYETIEDFLYKIPDKNLKILADNYDIFLQWDEILWKILELISNENISLLKKEFFGDSKSITLKTLAKYNNFIKQYNSINFEEYNYENNREKELAIENIINQTDDTKMDLLYTFYKIFSIVNTEKWELGLLIFLYNNNETSKRISKPRIRKQVKDIFSL